MVLKKNKRIKNDQLDRFLNENVEWNIGARKWNSKSYTQEMNLEKNV